MAEKKLPKGVYLRKDGRYEGRFMYHGESFAVYGEDPRKVKKKLDDLRYEVQHNIYDKPSKMTVDRWFDEWIEVYKEPNIKRSTLDLKKRYYRIHVGSRIGKKYIVDIVAKDIQKIYNELAANGYSTSAIMCVKSIMNEMFSQAYKEKIIRENPVALATVTRGTPRKTHPALTKREQELFVKYAEKYGGEHYDSYILALCTGMRRGEMLGLRWRDVDFKNRVIHITGTVSRNGNGLVRTSPKTQTSKRDIPMIDSVYDLLKKHKREQLREKLKAGDKWKPQEGLEDLVFPSNVGTLRWPHAVCERIDVIINHIREDGYEISDFTFHSFRHTFATRAIEGGMNPQTLKAIMGHSNLQTTMDIYSHVMEDTKAEEMRMISGMF